MDSFEEAVAETLPPYPGRGIRRTPESLLQDYGSLIQMIREGYDDNIYEYDNDLSIRDFIERVLTYEVFRPFPQLSWFRDEVARLDEQFRPLLSHEFITSGSGWWDRCLPLRAGEELVHDMRETYGYAAEVVS